MLPTEFPRIEMAATQISPQHPFRTGHATPQSSRKLDIFPLQAAPSP
jgi:hypothetical protein